MMSNVTSLSRVCPRAWKWTDWFATITVFLVSMYTVILHYHVRNFFKMYHIYVGGVYLFKKLNTLHQWKSYT